MKNGIDESNIGVYLWIVLLLLVNTWIPMDIWLRRHGHEYLTDEFREGLQKPGWNIVLIVMTFGTLGLFVYHFFIQH
jgi:hypothetical protein